ncbi:cellobiose dehydrogenase [Geopyxis carbonaria]|nr:cellobiose dehydrogenase [Geopyxis carbonaria]
MQAPLADSERLDGDWDYIVVGTGPAGLVLADRLSEAGKKTLVLEAGTRSTYATGGREAPDWIQTSGEPISRFDVPGFFQSFAAHPDGHQCGDIPVLAGCVMGGGSAINSGIYFLPSDADWNRNFPPGWHAADTARAQSKARRRNPGTTNPSQDGKLWFPEAFDIFSQMLRGGGWTQVDANRDVNAKNTTYARTPFMNLGGLRAGPLGTYAVTALARRNARFVFGAKVQRVLRRGDEVTGLEYTRAADNSTQRIAVRSGARVILSAGALGSPKILLQSGIGPRAQLEIVKAARGPAMIDAAQWIDLPVGHNLIDHTATYIVLRHPDAGTGYNYSGAWDAPDAADAALYLRHRAGPLASSNARISLWQALGSHVVQWNGRVGTAGPFTGPNLLLLTNYLTLGTTSRGRLALAPATLDITFPELPYLTTPADTAAVVAAFEGLLAAFDKAQVPGLELVSPTREEARDVAAWVRGYALPRGSNHWVGTTAMAGGAAPQGVVDGRCRVKGVRNLHVVDAGVFPGLPSSNLVGAVVVLAERAAEVLLGL